MLVAVFIIAQARGRLVLVRFRRAAQIEQRRFLYYTDAMRILIISDTHRKIENLKTVIARIGTPDHLIHCGDLQGAAATYEAAAACPGTFVRGNCDFDDALPAEAVVALGAHRIFVTHGHLYQARYGNDVLAREALARDCKLCCFGHTHMPELDRSFAAQGLTVLNPGSLSKPRQYPYEPTCVIMEIDEKGVAHYNFCAVQMNGTLRAFEPYR